MGAACKAWRLREPKLQTLQGSPLGNAEHSRCPGDPDPHDHIKGVGIAAVLHAYSHKRDPERLREVLEAMTPEQLGDLKPGVPGAGVVPSKWYPSAFVHALFDGLCQGLTDDEVQLLAEQLEGAVMDATLHGAYKLFFRLVFTPERYAHYSQPLWTRFYSSGRLESRVDGDIVTSRIVNWRGYHSFLCRMNREAARIIYMAMGRHVISTATTECRAAGDAACGFRLVLAPRRKE